MAIPSPALPLAPRAYDTRYQDQNNRILTQYFARLYGMELAEEAAEAANTYTDTAVVLTLRDGLALVSTLAGATTVTLPDAAAVPNRVFSVKRTTAGANTLTISTLGGTIDGASSVTIAAQYGYRAFKSDGTNYWIIGSM